MLRLLTAFLPLILIPAQLSAQTPTAPTTPAYTLHTSTRVVLTDVTVIDSHGNPVHGLDRSVFRIFDNNQPQQLASFEEHLPQPPSPTLQLASTSPNTFSNDYLLHPTATSNILFLDTTTLNVVDQMYLNQQLEKFLPTLPPGQPIAIYARTGEYTLLLQNFTDDHARLLTAIHKAIPHLRNPAAQDANDYQTLQQIISYLSQLPGRKNVLWFSGGSSFFLTPDATTLPAGLNLQPLYDALETSRIALYPIDARGLTVYPPFHEFDQHALMDDVAEATGGHAFYNTNGLSQLTTKLLATDASFYTLTYTPQDSRLDNKWHKVKVQVTGASYTLSYRHGYFDDGSNTKTPTDRPRTLLRSHGETATLAPHDEPIIFRARVLPQSELPAVSSAAPQNYTPKPPKKDEIAYSIHFTAPVQDFFLHPIDGQPHVILGAATLAFNQDGLAIARAAQQFTITLDPVKLSATTHGVIDFEQQINLPKGQDYLYLAIWDITTGRLGTIQLPLQVNK